MPTAHLFLYLVGLGTALSTQSSVLPRLFSGSETFLRPWQKNMSITLSSQRYWNTNLVQRETIG